MAASPAMTMLRGMVATTAIHDGERDDEDYTGVCHPGTREDYLEDLMIWSDNGPTDKRVRWTNAVAGAGKTAMLRTFCTKLEERSGFPSVSFFAWEGDARRNTLKHFPATIGAQLCRRISALAPHIEKAINDDSFLLQSAFKKQMDKLVIRPLLDACDTVKGERHLIIVIDGLDELDTNGQTELLSFIPTFLSRLSSLPISLLLSSRPEAMIVGAFQHPRLASVTAAIRLGASDEDIWTFLNDKFDDINLRFPYLQRECGDKWPNQEKREIMIRQSSGLFIWPTVAIGHIDKVEKGLRHNERLEQVLSSAGPKPWVASPLDNLYRAILEAHAPEDRESAEFLQFKRRVALLCLPVNIGMFVWEPAAKVVDWTDTPTRAVFEETLDALRDSVTGLSSLFTPEVTLSRGESPTPVISHRSFRDFTFNRTRCGDDFYYSSEQDLHTEVVCKFIKFFRTQQAYQSCAEMSARFIDRAEGFLKSHLKDAAASEELGSCMDDIMLFSIPPTWPLVTQVYLIATLFNTLYDFIGNPEFPEGPRRQEALLSKVTVFVNHRIATAQEWDIGLLRLALSTTDFTYDTLSYHSTHCWHVARSPQCICMRAYGLNLPFIQYQQRLFNSTLVRHANSPLLANRQDNIPQDSLDVLQFIISLSETSQRAIELSPFVDIKINYWIIHLLQHCRPNEVLFDALAPICMATLPYLPVRYEDDSWTLIELFLRQTQIFNTYSQRCREAGIKRESSSPVKIPDDWWQDEEIRWSLLWCWYRPIIEIPDGLWQDEITRDLLFMYGYKPPIEILDHWWDDNDTRKTLLQQGYKPTIKIPDYWWRDEGIRRDLLRCGYEPTVEISCLWWYDKDTRKELLKQGYKPTFEVPDGWWHDDGTRDELLKQGYEPPVSSASAFHLEDDDRNVTDSDNQFANQGADVDEGRVSDEEGAHSAAAAGETYPSVAFPEPFHVQRPVSAPPTATPGVGVENGQAGSSSVVAGHRRRRLGRVLQSILRR